jgi:hypothetical protein
MWLAERSLGEQEPPPFLIWRSGKLQMSRLPYSAVNIASPLPEQLTTHTLLSQPTPSCRRHPTARIHPATFAIAAIMHAFPPPAEQTIKNSLLHFERWHVLQNG